MSDLFDKLRRKKEEAEKVNSMEEKKRNNVNGNSTITITSKKENEKLKRTYYIDPKQDQNITWAARKTGRDKSEIVRIALDYFFDNVEIKG